MSKAEDREWARIAAKMDSATCHEYIRKHILEYKGIPGREVSVNGYEDLWKAVKESMEPFLRLMRNRILMGRFRYGEFGKRHIDAVEDMKRLLKQYETTRNTEFLVDLANYAWIEFKHGTHPDKHFEAIDDGAHSKM